MNSADLVVMLGNLSRSMFSIQYFISGLAYLLGAAFFIVALMKLKAIGAAHGHSNERAFVPVAYMLGGSALIYLPSAVSLMANTAFGVGNVLQYTPYSAYDIKATIPTLIRTGGLIWFVRGCVLLVNASNPGIQHGPKGLAFLCAGVLAMNFESSIAFLNYIMGNLISLTMSIKNSQGY